MIIIAFFFLLCPNEYTDNNKTPFRLTNIQLFIGDTSLRFATIEQLRHARFATLTFTDQKYGVFSKVISLACSGDPFLCPVLAVVRHFLYLWSHSAPPKHPSQESLGLHASPPCPHHINP
jgi:hypothetical protein